MSNASKDENGVSSLIAVEQTDGRTIVKIRANPTTHKLAVSNGTGGTDYGPTNALRDQNSVPTLLAVSSADGVTPVVVYADLDGNLLVSNS